MDNIFELNTVNNVKDEVGASKVKSTSSSGGMPAPSTARTV